MLIADLKAWQKWNYWSSADPAMKVTYSDVTFGPGANYSWSSADGDGTVNLVSAQKNENVRLTLDLVEKGKGNVIWSFKEEGGKTKVTWTFFGDAQNYLGRWFTLMIGPMIRTPMAASLRKIKELTEGD